MALALVTLGACTGGSAADGSAADSKSTTVGTTTSPLPPGKYQTLPQPCTSVSPDTLKKLIPGAADYTGKESLTYDTDRLVGCSWASTTSDGTTSSLAVDLERVVSYDPAISDEVQAETDFDQKAEAAQIPLASSSDSATPTTSSGGTSTATGTGTATGTAATTSGLGTDSGTSTATPTDSSGTPDPDLAPRLLSGVGNAAFIDDVLTEAAAGAKTGPRRDVTLVFRTANVVVTVTYIQTAPSDGQAPRSSDLQEGAQNVAGQLESRIEG
ncbi:MAG: hypothetical protein QOF98_2401 [Streptomyces sp.]|nr:hypothetical protein [Streptomyces sp.]